MNDRSANTNHVLGICAIVAILSSVGCAVIDPVPGMSASSLEHYQIDCTRKQEQIAFLESMRTNSQDRLNNWTSDQVRFWEAYVAPQKSAERRSVSSGRNDWIINQKLQRLQWDCGPTVPQPLR